MSIAPQCPVARLKSLLQGHWNTFFSSGTVCTRNTTDAYGEAMFIISHGDFNKQRYRLRRIHCSNLTTWVSMSFLQMLCILPMGSPLRHGRLNWLSESTSMMNGISCFWTEIADFVTALLPSSTNALAKEQLGYRPILDEKVPAAIENMPEKLRNADSVYLIRNGKPYIRSAAGIRCVLYMRWYYKMWFPALWLIPLPLRNIGYRLIAKYRHKFFKRPTECLFRVIDANDARKSLFYGCAVRLFMRDGDGATRNLRISGWDGNGRRFRRRKES